MATELPNGKEDLSALGREVKVVDIDRRLKDLWDANKTVSRASLLNLVIYSEEPDSVRRNTQLVISITREHACRVLLVEAHPNRREQAVRSWITAHCGLTAEIRQGVCCEQVTFRLDGLSPSRLVNLIFAHVESDLPLVLWWQSSFQRHFDKRIYRRIDRLIIDSARWGESWITEFRMLLRASRDKAKHFVVHDLDWTRIFHCRLAVAACFDPPTAAEDLRRIREIEIAHGPAFRSTAILLAAWVTDRLKGSVVARSDSRFTLELEASRRRVDIILTDGVDSSAITGVGFRGDDVEYRVTSDPEEPYYAIWNHAEGRTPSLLMPRDSTDLATLVIDQLGRGSSNASYFQVMKLAASMQRGGGEP